MLNDNLMFNYRSIRSYTRYACEVDTDTFEKEVSFHVAIGPSTERKGDNFPVYHVPDGKMLWLSDWTFCANGQFNPATHIGGCLGRITPESQYIYVLNCVVSAGETKLFSPARPIRYLPDEWLAVCFHHTGEPLDLLMRATFRFTEVPCAADKFKTEVFDWAAKREDDLFPGDT